jgi:chorismate mutase
MTTHQDPQKALSALRKEIDKADREILTALKKRFRLSGRVKILKKKHGIKAIHKKRESKIVTDLRKRANGSKVPIKLINELYERIFLHARGKE